MALMSDKQRNNYFGRLKNWHLRNPEIEEQDPVYDHELASGNGGFIIEENMRPYYALLITLFTKYTADQAKTLVGLRSRVKPKRKKHVH